MTSESKHITDAPLEPPATTLIHAVISIYCRDTDVSQMDLYICEIAPLWPFTLHETFLPQSVVHIHSLFSFRFPPSQHDARTCPPQPPLPDRASMRRVRRALRPRSVMRLRDTAVITPDADRVSKQETPQTGFPNRIIPSFVVLDYFLPSYIGIVFLVLL